VVLIRTPSTSKKMVSNLGGTCKSGLSQMVDGVVTRQNTPFSLFSVDQSHDITFSFPNRQIHIRVLIIQHINLIPTLLRDNLQYTLQLLDMISNYLFTDQASTS